MNYLFDIIIYPILYILPAYVANGAPVIFGGGAPLDFHKKFRGKRIFGDHKTIKGTVSSLIAGIIIGLIESHFFSYLLPISILLVIGANIGDLFGSFIKRQVEFKPGKSAPILDQYGFFIFALIFAFSLGHLPDLYGLIFLVIVTGILHLLTNIGAYLLKLKSVPW